MATYLLILAVLNFSPLQKAFTEELALSLSDDFGSEVTIGSVEVGLFNRLILHDVSIRDLQGERLLKAKVVSVKIELRSLVRERLALRTVSLLDADINLYKEKEDGPTNFQFVIDTFADDEEEEEEESPLNLRINSLILRRVNVGYDERYRPRTPRRFNPSHIHVQQLNANISLKEISPQGLRLRIRSLAFKEHSGIEVRNIRLRLQASLTEARINDFEISLAHSQISQSDLTATYDVRKSLADLFPTLRIEGSLRNVTLSSEDVRPFARLPRTMDLTARLSTDFSVTPQKISLTRLRLSDGNDWLRLQAEASLLRKDSKPHSASVRLQSLEIDPAFTAEAATWIEGSPTLARILPRLGKVSAHGSTDYRTQGASTATLTLQTAVGNATARTQWQGKRVAADFSLSEAQAGILLDRPEAPQMVTLTGKAQLSLAGKTVEAAKADIALKSATWRNYLYHDISLAGSYRNGRAEATLRSADPNLLLDATARLALQGKTLRGVDLTAHAANVAPAAIGLATPYGNALFSGRVEASLDLGGTRATAGIPLGSVTVSDFAMTGSPRGDYALSALTASLERAPLGECLSLRSDFLDADVEGPLNLPALKGGILAIALRALPGLTSEGKGQGDGNWRVSARLKSTDFFRQMLGVPVDLEEGLYAQGFIDAGQGRTSLTAHAGALTVAGQRFDRPRLYLNGSADEYQCLLQTHRVIGKADYAIVADLRTAGGKLLTHVNWHGDTQKEHNGELSCTTQFLPSASSVNFRTQVHPTQFTLSDTVWTVASGQFALQDGNVAFDDLRLSHRDQWLTVDGELTRERNDSVVARLNRIDISYILGLANFHAVEFEGQATGTATLSRKGDTPQLNVDINVPELWMNGGTLGKAHILGDWNPDDNRIGLDAALRLPGWDGTAGTDVKGGVSLKDKSIELDIHARHTDLAFLQHYMDGIFSDFGGDATGHVRLYGPLKQLDFAGSVKANAVAKVVATGVKYRISEADVEMSAGRFAFRDCRIADHHGGTGTAQANLYHNHLKNLSYDLDVQAAHLRCYDQSESLDMPFYSTATGTGRVTLQGDNRRLLANIDIRTDAPTSLVYNLDTQQAFSKDDRMIKFHAVTGQTSPDGLLIYTPVAPAPLKAPGEEEENDDDTQLDIYLNFLINTTPAAQVKVVTDARSGDAITVYGSGPIRATFHNKGNFRMYGTYTVERGTYKLSIQEIIRKDLSLRQGSTITFSGVPLQADLDLNAVYTIHGVPLSDLNYGSELTQKSARVDCILHIGGKAQAPQVDFDLDLHNISDDEKQMLKQLIATEEDMNRQVIYLLGVGRFYTANSAAATAQAGSQQQSTVAMQSFLSTTLTNQLNTAISSAMGNQSKWSFGTNVMPGTLGWNDVEVDGLLQGRLLNDRLLINGNFGYRDRPTYTSNFVGDFDIRYLLTPRGSVSLRAYSETNDRYFTKSSLTTQGVGISLSRDFNSLRELFRIRKKEQE